MIHIERLPEPEPLLSKHAQWQEKYDAALRGNPSARPDHKKYAHPAVVESLSSASHNKCYYCETLLTEDDKEVDHHVEVACDHSRAYDWTNLYLACHNCNRGRADNRAIPVGAVLDPCEDSDTAIAREITFRDERVMSVPGSARGVATIDKYKLNSTALLYKRLKVLQAIAKEVNAIRDTMADEGRATPDERERHDILLHRQPDQPFSMMARQYIDKELSHFLQQ